MNSQTASFRNYIWAWAALVPALTGGVCLAAGTNVEIMATKIESVTLYRDRAQVVRSTTKEFPAGRYSLVFDNIPAAIDEHSLQVNRQGHAILHDVRLKKVFVKANSNARLDTLNKQLQDVKDKTREADDRLVQLKSEKTVITQIVAKATSPQEKNTQSNLDTTKWVKLADFHRERGIKLDKEIRQTEQQKRVHDEEQEKLTRQIVFLNTDQGKEKNQVEVAVEVTQTGKITLDLSYIVSGSSWTPLYDLRVNSDKKLIDLTYNAVIRQNTAEDWDNVKIKLSTAQPQLGGEVPTQTPQYLTLYDPTDVSVVGGGFKSKDRIDQSRGKAEFGNQQLNAKSEPVVIAKKLPLNAPVEVSKVEDQLSSAVFIIHEKNTIKSDNTPHKVQIMQQQMPVSLRYTSVPKLSPYAYLKAGVVNKTAYPLLAGTTNVFLDNNFVASAAIDTIAPNEMFWTHLGVDDGIKVKYKFINKFEEKSGVFTKSQKYTYEFQINVTNTKKHPIDLWVSDQLPISRDKEITIELLSAKDHIEKITEHQFVLWKFNPKADEKISIPLKYSITFPVEKKLSVNAPIMRNQLNR